MRKLIPGRIRNQGRELFESGQMSLEQGDEGRQVFLVDQQEVTFLPERGQLRCDCVLFGDKGYCQHWAAAELFIKEQEKDRLEETAASLDVPTKRTDHLFASRFLAALAEPEGPAAGYELAASGEIGPYSRQLWWTLKIRRLPDQRFYIIRDIRAFLTQLAQGGHYQFGKQYYEPLVYGRFDRASQELLDFLGRLASLESASHFPNNQRYLHLPSGFFEEGLLLLGQLPSFELDLYGFREHRPVVEPLAGQAELFQFVVTVDVDGISLRVRETLDYQLYDGAFLAHQGVFYAPTTRQQQLIKSLRSLPVTASGDRYLLLALEDQDQVSQHLLEFAQLGKVEAPAAFIPQDFEVLFQLDWPGENWLQLSTTLVYANGLTISRSEDYATLPFASNHQKKHQLNSTLTSLGFADAFQSGQEVDAAGLYQFFEEDLPRLRALGKVNLSAALASKRQLERPRVELRESAGLLEVNFAFDHLDQEEISQALTSLQNQEPYFVNKLGQLLIFDEESQRVAQVLMDLRAQESGTGRYQLSQVVAYRLQQQLAGSDRLILDKDLERMAGHVSKPWTFPKPEVAISQPLRDYQAKGVQWLAMLDHYGFGGVLADDMGLGKTLQTIAFLSSLERLDKRILILAPASLIYNWQEEFAKFAPQIAVNLVYGSKDQRLSLLAQDAQVTLTSYQAFRQDLEAYQALGFDYLILDEAQGVKNSQTKLAQALKVLQVERCFALSGTPIENRLQDLWSLFELVLPGLFPSRQAFLKLSTQEVARIIQPFVLRRKKEDVLPELPEVTEKVYTNELSDGQKAIYLAQVQAMQDQIRGLTSREFAQQRVAILAGLTRLRQICNSPSLFMPYEGSSGKLESLRELLLQLQASGHRPLIFSQFRGMLDLVEEELAQQGLTSYKLTGSTPARDRQAMSQAFNKGGRDAFLISLKAGGVGLNLTGADAVILIDLWWNPAVEAQAIGRAHRLGQKKAVQVFRLITQGTIEEKIQALQESKRHLIQEVLEGQDAQASLSLDDLKEILGVS